METALNCVSGELGCKLWWFIKDKYCITFTANRSLRMVESNRYKKKIQGYFEVSIANFKLIHAFYSRFVFGTVLSSMPELLSWLSVD